MVYTRKILDFETEKLRLKLNVAFAQRDKEHFFYLCDVFDSLTIKRFLCENKATLTQERETDAHAMQSSAISCEG